MPPRSPLPPRHGLQAAWVRTPDRGKESPDWETLSDFLLFKLAKHAPTAQMLADGRFVLDDGTPITGREPYRPHTFIWFHRDRRDEPVVPFKIELLYADERIVVIDKPHFLATIPRGNHVLQSVVVRVRNELGFPDASPAHRLDRLTAGVLVLTTEKKWRGAYQEAFRHRQIHKRYDALAPISDSLEFPQVVRNHIVKERGNLQAVVYPDREPNSETLVELAERRGNIGCYRLTPITGRTHQLRVHLNALDIPIMGDPLYPKILDVDIDDFSTPLQLVARELSFIDPVDGTRRHFASKIPLDWPTND